MSRKTHGVSSTSTRSAKRRTPSIPETQSLPVSTTTASVTGVVERDLSASQQADPYDTPEFRLSWDNKVGFHVSRHLMQLRRYRKMSQAKLALEIGTSQPAIARIEGGDENPTLDTVERMVVALNGRFQVAIPPAELSTSRKSVWWEQGSGWTFAGFGHRVTADLEEALILFQRELSTKAVDTDPAVLSNRNAA